MWIKNPTDATVCRYLFTAKLLYMFRVSQHPSSGVSKTVPAASGIGHTTCTATPLLCGLVWISCTSRVLLMMGAVTPETCRVVLQWINVCILLHLLDIFIHIEHRISFRNNVFEESGTKYGENEMFCEGYWVCLVYRMSGRGEIDTSRKHSGGGSSP